METINLTPKKLEKVIELLKTDPDKARGIYLMKGLKIHISKYQASAKERYLDLYHRRKEQGLCIICGTKVTVKNPRTKKKYRMCEEHREKYDKKKGK